MDTVVTVSAGLLTLRKFGFHFSEIETVFRESVLKLDEKTKDRKSLDNVS
jgi:hypothetical protein